MGYFLASSAEEDVLNMSNQSVRSFLCLLVVASTFLVGCQSTPNKPTITQSALDSLAAQWVITETCYNYGVFDLDTHVNYQQSINYLFSTWTVTQEQMNEAVAVARARVNHNAQADASCKQQQPALELMVRTAQNHYNQSQVNQKRQHEINKARASAPKSSESSSSGSSAFPSTVQCKKLGEFLNVEIKTFQGPLCPIGWISA